MWSYSRRSAFTSPSFYGLQNSCTRCSCTSTSCLPKCSFSVFMAYWWFSSIPWMPLNAAATLPARAVHRYRNLSVSERVVFSCTACRNHSLNSCHPSRSSLHSCSSTFGSSKIPALLVDDAAVVVSVMLFRCRCSSQIYIRVMST